MPRCHELQFIDLRYTARLPRQTVALAVRILVSLSVRSVAYCSYPHFRSPFYCEFSVIAECYIFAFAQENSERSKCA